VDAASDCGHWCLPGPYDVVSDILFHALLVGTKGAKAVHQAERKRRNAAAALEQVLQVLPKNMPQEVREAAIAGLKGQLANAEAAASIAEKAEEIVAARRRRHALLSRPWDEKPHAARIRSQLSDLLAEFGGTSKITVAPFRPEMATAVNATPGARGDQLKFEQLMAGITEHHHGPSHDHAGGQVRLLFQSPVDGLQDFHLHASRTAKIVDLMAEAAKKVGVRLGEVRLTRRSMVLGPQQTLASYGVRDGDHFKLHVRREALDARELRSRDEHHQQPQPAGRLTDRHGGGGGGKAAKEESLTEREARARDFLQALSRMRGIPPAAVAAIHTHTA